MNKNTKTSLTYEEYVRLKALGILGLIDSDISPQNRADRLTFINNLNEARKELIKAYNVWYVGDSNELLNYYSRATAIDYNSNPFYNRNNRNYFWCVSATEENIKRTHSGKPRDIVDTLNHTIGIPSYGVGSEDSVLKKVDDILQEILEDNNFDEMLSQRSRPLTFVEGWGAYKINWDMDFRDTPILLYYRADAVDFIYRSSQLVAIIYKDYYQDEKKRDYVLFETRRLEKRKCTIEGHEKYGQLVPCLIVEKELFECPSQTNQLVPCEFSKLPQLKDVQPTIVFENFKHFLGVPSIYFEDTSGDMPGRSIYAGKLDMFDDLDQCYSQASNTVRRSTVHEYFDVQYLEKDEKTGTPIMPKAYDRSYVMFKGSRNGDGSTSSSSPVQVVQPSVDFAQYSAEEQNILLNIICGLMSPATLGIDIAKKDNAEAQREKEKVTIFTRNGIIKKETKILKRLFNDLLCAHEFMRKGYITNEKYDIFVRYNELASNSYENRADSVLSTWQAGLMSDELALEILHGDSLNEAKIKKELEFIKANKEKEQDPFGSDKLNPEDMGAFGQLGADNEYNQEHTRHWLDKQQEGEEANE